MRWCVFVGVISVWAMLFFFLGFCVELLGFWCCFELWNYWIVVIWYFGYVGNIELRLVFEPTHGNWTVTLVWSLGLLSGAEELFNCPKVQTLVFLLVFLDEMKKGRGRPEITLVEIINWDMSIKEVKESINLDRVEWGKRIHVADPN